MPLEPLDTNQCPSCLTIYSTPMEAAACRQIDAGDGLEKRIAYKRRQQNLAAQTGKEN